jgi:hypothetical protein
MAKSGAEAWKLSPSIQKACCAKYILAQNRDLGHPGMFFDQALSSWRGRRGSGLCLF